MSRDLASFFEPVGRSRVHGSGRSRFSESAPQADRFAQATQARVILADISGSMAEKAGGRPKIDHLREALRQVYPTIPHARLIAFSTQPVEISDPSNLPAPKGGTALDAALRAAAAYQPCHTVVISDGRPDSPDDALRVAHGITGRIDVVFCGRDWDATAIAFMRELARVGLGEVVVHDLTRVGGDHFAPAIGSLLALPKPATVVAQKSTAYH